MSTRRNANTPPFIVDDPGSWGMIAQVQRAIGGQMGAHHRRHVPIPGILMMPQRAVPIPTSGLSTSESTPVGVGRLKVVAALPDPADRLRFADDGKTLYGESPRAKRSWTFPSLTPAPVIAEEQAPVPVPPLFEILADDDLGDLPIVAPGGEYAALIVRDGRLPAMALVRLGSGLETRELVRWITGVAAAAWSPDGRLFALSGDWGVLITVEG